MARPLAFIIHHLNPWGGHDRSTLEIAKSISKKNEVEICAYALEGTAWKPSRFFHVRPFFKRPAILLVNYFHVATFFYWLLLKLRPKSKRPVLHSTGTASLFMDVVQVQFVNEAWKKTLGTLSERTYQRPGIRGGGWLSGGVRQLYHTLYLKYTSWVERCLYTKKKKYIAISRSVKAELKLHFGLPDSIIAVIHHGVDADFFSPSLLGRQRIRRALNISEEATIILFVGEFERKGLAVTISALGKIKEGFHLVVIGNGRREGFVAAARRYGFAERLHFVGHVKNVNEYYQAGDIFILPTLYEPFGLVILEAMAAGLACVVSEVAGASELITAGVSGEIIKNPQDAEEVAHLVRGLIVDINRRRQMGEAARKVGENRSWEKVANEYYQFMKPLLEQNE